MNRTSISRKGITLPEIMLAMLIMAMAMIPIFGLMTRDVKDTDTLVASSFAIDKARLVLHAIIDEVAFADLAPGVPAVLSGAATSLAKELFPGAAKVGSGYACSGIATGVRGIHYQIFLRADPVVDSADGYTPGEFGFSYYRNPKIEDQAAWASMTAYATKQEQTLQPSIYRPGGPSNPLGGLSPYRFINTGLPYTEWGPEEEIKNPHNPIDQRQISQPNADTRYYLMQRLVLQIRWNLASQYYKTPTAMKGRPQRIHIITYKANLD